ncbi:MAG: PIN domain-containing protein [Actinobacteria bacterium]|nr:PIN domain-containing protein [Actinomycetota bacterium]
MTLEFVDTSILLHAYDVGAGVRHDQAAELLTRLGRARTGVISVQVLQEFHVNATRKIAVPLTPSAARDRVRVLSLWHVHTPTPDDVLAASELAEHAQLSFWDAMIVRSAAVSGCSTLWSEDLNAGQRIAGVHVRNPFTP